MARKGWLHSRRMGRHSFYDLTGRGRHLLEEGRARILHPSWDGPWDETWFLLAYSIPEDVRHLRDRLRDRLAWLGFGSLGNGLWISPHDVSKEVADIAAGWNGGFIFFISAKTSDSQRIRRMGTDFGK